ncbi:MAG TPA: hypothetical protein VK327_09130 [Candidatus Paceibacterota bacterium]|nr:hypothetical protein [Candidatus Paceibacterota bacterium]
MKRSRSIRLVLIGTLSVGALTSCGPRGSSPDVTAQNVYTNNYFVPGAGYYHAPFRSWYPLPYNHYDPQNRLYFYGGQWSTSPHRSITNISPPTVEMAAAAQAQRTDIRRGGFGSSSGHHSWIHS